MLDWMRADGQRTLDRYEQAYVEAGSEAHAAIMGLRPAQDGDIYAQNDKTGRWWALADVPMFGPSASPPYLYEVLAQKVRELDGATLTSAETCSYGSPTTSIAFWNETNDDWQELVPEHKPVFSVCRYCGRTWREGSEPYRMGKCWDGVSGCGGNLD